MKKCMGLALLSAILVGAPLVSCGGTKSNSNSEIVQPNEPEVTSKWSKEAVALMKEHLNENVIPDFDVTDAEWYYDQDFDCVCLETTGGNEKADEIATQILKDTRYELSTEGDVDGYYTKTLFSWSKKDDVRDGYIIVDIYTDGTALEVDCYFYPILPSWDATKVSEALALMGADSVTLPAPSFDISYLEIYAKEADAGYISLSVEVKENFADTYIDQLLAAGYTEFNDENLGGMTLYLDPTTTIGVAVYYDDEASLVYIDIYALGE